MSDPVDVRIGNTAIVFGAVKEDKGTLPQRPSKVLDLGHPLSDADPTWSGEKVFSRTETATSEREGYFGSTPYAAEVPEVRQLVTFKFEPGMTGKAVSIFADVLLPVYKDAPALLRFRGYHEAESPEPLDLIVVSSFKGTAGMDALNAQLAKARLAGPSVRQLYGQLADLSAFHHDQFVEMIGDLAVAKAPSRLQVFESVRIVPGGRRDFERLLASTVVPWERGWWHGSAS